MQKVKSKPKVVKKKLVPIPKLKSRLWSIFSQYVRLLKSDEKGYCTCITCGGKVFWTGKSGANSGHFHSQRSNPALIFEPNNVWPQHRMCNKFQRNNITWDYFVNLEKIVGRPELDRLASLRGKSFKWERQWLEEKIEFYSLNVKALKLTKGL